MRLLSDKMDSKSLEQYGFRKWYPLNKLTISDLLYQQEPIPSVYVIRLKEMLPKVHDFVYNRNKNKDELVEVETISDILYIGETGNLIMRIFGNYLGGIPKDALTTQRIHRLLLGLGYLEKTEISWVVIKDHKKLEDELKRKHIQNYGKRPPWSHR